MSAALYFCLQLLGSACTVTKTVQLVTQRSHSPHLTLKTAVLPNTHKIEVRLEEDKSSRKFWSSYW
jgi:ribosomal protein L28